MHITPGRRPGCDSRTNRSLLLSRSRTTILASRVPRTQHQTPASVPWEVRGRSTKLLHALSQWSTASPGIPYLASGCRGGKVLPQSAENTSPGPTKGTELEDPLPRSVVKGALMSTPMAPPSP